MKIKKALLLITITISSIGCSDSDGENTLLLTDENDIKRHVIGALKVVDTSNGNAITKYFDTNFKEHNPKKEDGIDGLKKAFENNLKNEIQFKREVARVLVEGNLVFVHSRLVTIAKNETTSEIIGDIFKVVNGKIVEHWITEQIETHKDKTANGNSMIDGEGNPEASITQENLVRNKKNLKVVIEKVIGNAEYNLIPDFFGKTYIQHNPGIDNGVKALQAFLTSLGKLDVEIKQIIAQGDLAVAFSHYKNPANKGLAIMDLFRFDVEGKVVEHWDVVHSIPNDSLNSNDFF
ncbi:nuclear transport factor 2 family protein [Tenacibaculum sp. 190524A02b]|uniref:SnoaL-like domain-containing protein n=1 Tax=Tenacibaculum vairaonense TaxID=3137860 RepID=A0ABM9PHV5_9FLAO